MINKPKVSVIVPAFNNARYLNTCLDSILNQTYQDFEVIVYNDGSTDDSEYILNSYNNEYSNVFVYSIENRGQGYCRNRALEKARGDFILFVDSDDFIESITLETLIKRIEEDCSDMVVFDYKYFKNGIYTYSSVNQVFKNKTLNGKDCLKILGLDNFFSVTKFYKKSFLNQNHILYGEGHLYEDLPFLVNCAVKATKISLLHSPLYTVRVTSSSSTKTNYDSNIHADSFIQAAQLAIDLTKEIDNSDNSLYPLYKYLINRFWLYCSLRVPEQYRDKMKADFIQLMSHTYLGNPQGDDALTNLYYENDVFSKKDLNQFNYFHEKLLKQTKNQLFKKRIKSKIKNTISKFKNTNINTDYAKKYNPQNTPKQDIILFYGFDNRYTGNSRYLFEEILKLRNHDIYYVTSDEQVDSKYRLEPESEEFYKILSMAQIVIFESWIPQRFVKSTATWIQLWHGTPIKKILYDSNEEEIVSINPKHKITKFKDLYRWSFLLTDNSNVNHFFETAFLIPKRKLLSVGYPRVNYLIQNKNNSNLKQAIKKKAGIPLGKKIVTYLPTWRDYNYSLESKNQDTDYLLNLTHLKKLLPNDYYIVSKNHVYNDSSTDQNNTDLETQELLLISDYLVSDFSSVIFDAIAIDIPVLLFVNDFEKYQNSRGVYDELWFYLRNLAVDSVEDLARSILSYSFSDSYQYLKNTYSFNNSLYQPLSEIILKMAYHRGKFLENALLFESVDSISEKLIDRISYVDSKLQVGNRADNHLVLAITNTTIDNPRFQQIKKSFESFSEIAYVIPVSGDKPTVEDIERNMIDVVFTEENDSTNYHCKKEFFDNN